MQIRKWTTFVVSVLALNVYAQQPSYSGFGGSSGGNAILPEQFRLNSKSELGKDEVVFFRLNYRTNTLDLRTIKKYTDYNVPESIVIQVPDLSRFDHTVVLIGISGKSSNPTIVVWLAGNYNYNNITFYIDYDQDRDFTNDKAPIRVKAGDDPIKIELKPKNGSAMNMWLGVPKKQEASRKPKMIINNSIAVEFNAGAGSGDLSYKDDVYDYHTNISEKNIGAGFYYYSDLFLVGLSASFQNHYYYASYNQRHTVIGSANRDLHTPNKLQVGVLGGLRIPLTSYIEIQPTFQYGIAQYLNPEYKLNRFEDETLHIGASKFYEYGVRMEFVVGIQSAFFVGFYKNLQEWEPEGLAVSDNFKSNLSITKFRVGYKFSILQLR